MNVTEIWRDSPLWRELEHAIRDPKTYKISIADDGGIKVKHDEQMWSPPLSGTACKQHKMVKIADGQQSNELFECTVCGLRVWD